MLSANPACAVPKSPNPREVVFCKDWLYLLQSDIPPLTATDIPNIAQPIGPSAVWTAYKAALNLSKAAVNMLVAAGARAICRRYVPMAVLTALNTGTFVISSPFSARVANRHVVVAAAAPLVMAV